MTMSAITSSLPSATAALRPVATAAANNTATTGTEAAPASGSSPASSAPPAGKSSGAQTSSSAPTSSKALVQTSNGEYTADSVADNQQDAMALGLVKQKDGNYAAQKPVDASTSAASRSSSAVQAALNGLTLGG